MKIILKIARKELELLFYSPIAWVLLMLFVIQTAMLFTGKYAEYLQVNEYRDGVQRVVSTRLFIMGLWPMVAGYVYFYIPLLTMGLVSRELNSGSIKLLYSSPLTNTQIIMGKFIAMVIYAGVMCAILLLYVVVAACTVQGFELGAVLVGLLGLFLMMCTYMAVGIFVSSLTSYQFVAAVGTFLVLMFLSYVATWGQEYDVVRDITYWLSIRGRALTFILGMLCSEDLLYFPLVTFLFLALTVIRLDTVRQRVPFFKTLSKNLSVVLVVCFLGYLSSRPMLMAYYDASSTKWNTLSKQSQDIVSKLDGGLTITGYCNVLYDNYGTVKYPYFTLRNREKFKQYERFKPELDLQLVYYYDTVTIAEGEGYANNFARKCKKTPNMTLWERAKERCENSELDSMMLKSPGEIRKQVDLTGERTFVWLIKRENGDSTWLRIYADMNVFPTEAEISAALNRLTAEVPKVGFVASGGGMRRVSNYSPRGYSQIAGDKSIRESLLNQGFDGVEVDLRELVPATIDILVIADMQQSFSIEEENSLTDYVNRGGNLWVLGEPRSQAVMNPFLRKLFGVELTEGMLVQYAKTDFTPDVLCGIVTPEAKELSFHYGVMDYAVLPTGTGVELVEDKGFRMTPLLKCDTIAPGASEKRKYLLWNELGPLNYLDQLEYNPETGEKAGVYYPMIALTRQVGNKEQRVLITGDADCISNGELAQNRSSLKNKRLMIGSFSYLSDNKLPVDIRRPSTTDTRVLINRTGYNVLYGGFMVVLPLLFLGTGLFLWFRRRGR